MTGNAKPRAVVANCAVKCFRRALARLMLAFAQSPITYLRGATALAEGLSIRATGRLLIVDKDISKRLAGEYAWAMLWTRRHLLEVFLRRSETSPMKRIKTFRYTIGEPVEPLRSEFKRHTYRRKIFTMS